MFTRLTKILVTLLIVGLSTAWAQLSPGIYAPASGSTLTSTTVTFQWGAYSGATAYWLDVGSTQGGNNYAQSGSLSSSTSSYTVNGLPSDGSPVYATWWYYVGGQWQYIEYSYTAFNSGSSIGVITSPTPGSTLSGSSQLFSWTPGSGATAYWIDAGSAPGGNQYFQSGNIGNVTSYTVSGLPTNGSTVYVTLYSLVDGQWLNNQYTYTAFNLAGSQGVLTMPTPGSQFTATTVTFAWTAGAGASAYWLDLGNVPGGNQYYQSGNLGNVLTVTVSGLPSNGSTIYATLYSLVGGQWLPNSYTYTAYNQAGVLGVIQTPAPGSTLSGNSVLFTWSAGTGATAYWLDVGSTPGGNDIWQSGNLGNVLQDTVTTLPANGSQIYVTLWSLVGGQWSYNQYTYTSGPSFSLSVSPASAGLIQGQQVSYAVNLTSSNGFSGLAALSVSGVPGGIQATFSPPAIGAGEQSILTLSAPSNQALGVSTLTVSASATIGGLPVQQSATATLQVEAISTSFVGRTVVDDYLRTPIAGVTVTLLGVDASGNQTGCSGQTVSDGGGNFLFTSLPPNCTGPQLIGYDGSTATSPQGRYAGVNLSYTLTADQVTSLARVDSPSARRQRGDG